MRLKQRHRDEPGLAVIAYGKLGGKELGYGGDLDVVFRLRRQRRSPTSSARKRSMPPSCASSSPG
jgi:glutamine synthetase adenylyltransferase